MHGGPWLALFSLLGACVVQDAPKDRRDQDSDGAGQVDDSCDSLTWYADEDDDGWGAGDPSVGCALPAHAAERSGDCDDENAAVYPDAPELCDGLDDDCDGEVDEDPTDAVTLWTDEDADGYGDPNAPVLACPGTSGLSDNDLDCQDADPTINSEGVEVCDDADTDEDCDGLADDDDPDVSGQETVYPDRDSDGLGDGSVRMQACDPPPGYVEDDRDCDDSDDSVGLPVSGYADADGDGYGDAAVPASGCPGSAGFTSIAGDCDDRDADVHPGQSDSPYDGVDADCDGSDDYDADGDGAEAEDWGGTDCDDTNPDISTTQTIRGYPGDWNCDGEADLDVETPEDSSATFSLHGAVVSGAADVDADGSVEDEAQAVILGPSTGTELGSTLSSLGDMDGDGVEDVAASAPGDRGSMGRVWLVYGPVSGELNVYDFAVGIAGEVLEEDLGVGMVGGVDLDGDGRDELAETSGVDGVKSVILLWGDP